MNSGVSRRSLRRGRHVEILDHATLFAAAKLNRANVERLARSLGLEVDGLDPYRLASAIVRYMKRNPQRRER